jgi:GTPase
MALPVVAIVGRPNVGKSSLFNSLAGKRIAIVDPTPGVTRDRVSAPIELEDGFFELFDTGGIGNEDVDNLTNEIEGQIDTAIMQAAVILFVVDIREGVTGLDQHVSERLRAANKPVILVANKCDTPLMEPQAAELYRLGWGTPMCVSAQQGRGQEELFEAVHAKLPDLSIEPPPAEVRMKLAIVGRRNTGKSTFINNLAQSERMIVSEVAGTTRDSVDIYFESDGLRFMAIDTAGVRRKKSMKSDVEFYSMARAERSIRRADVVLLFLDAQLKISKVDKKLAEYILNEYKPAIFVVNKWDLLAPMPTSQYGDYLRKTFPSLDHVPIAFITAKEGRNVHAVLNLAQTLHKQACTRIGTGDLNRALRDALDANPPPMRFNRRPKINFATQVATNPPTIVLFTNGPELFDATYRRFLLKSFRDHFKFSEIAIKLYIRRKSRGDAPPGVLESEDPAEDRKNTSGRPLAEEPDARRGKPRKSRETRSGSVGAREKPSGERQESRGKKRSGATTAAAKGKSRKMRGEERGAQAADARSAKRKGTTPAKGPGNKKRPATPVSPMKAKSRKRAGEKEKGGREGRSDKGLWRDL